LSNGEKDTETAHFTPQIRRVRYIFPHPKGIDLYPLPQDSWFEHEKLRLLAFFRLVPNAALLRMCVANMLLEACNKDKFYQFADVGILGKITDVDRLYFINWIKHITTFVGLLSYEETVELENLAQQLEATIDIGQDIGFLPDKFRMRHDELDPTQFSYEQAVDEMRALKKQGKIIAIFHGSFDPAHFVHLLCANSFWQYCDYFIWAIDNDEFIKLFKVPYRDPKRKSYSEGIRLNIISHFPHLYDKLLVLPLHNLEDRSVIKIYNELCISIVCLSRFDEQIYKTRERQILAAGAQPFINEFLTHIPWFNSTELMRAVTQGKGFDPDLKMYHL
jgi:hypothetical protein